MKLKKYEQNKVKREIKIHGSDYSFYRTGKDEYGEQTEEKALVCELCGLFHTTSGYRTKNVSDGNVTHSKAQPMLLCVYDDAEQVQIGDVATKNQNNYIVTAKTNICEENILTDISLELVLNGKN